MVDQKERLSSRVETGSVAEQEIKTRAQKELLLQLKKTHFAWERVKLFGKIMDDYGVDRLVSLIPGWGDISASFVSTCYFLYEGTRIGLPLKDCLKILGYQTADVFVGAIPVVGDVADYFFKANKRSAKIFQKHFSELQKRAIEQGIPKSDLEAMQTGSAKFVKVMNEVYDKALADGAFVKRKT